MADVETKFDAEFTDILESLKDPKAVAVALSGGPGSASDLPAAAPVRAATAEIEQSLQRSGLVISDATDAARRRARRWVLALLLGLAAARVAQTLLAGNSNLMFLVLMSLLVLLIGSMMGRARLTRSGTRCLDQLRVLLADLARQGDRLKPGSSGRDMALLAAMFDADLVTAAADAIDASKRPLIVVGGGAQHASDEIRRLAELIQAPVVSFRNGRGVVSDQQPLGCNFAAGYEFWKTCDLVIGIGSRMQPYLQEWGVDEEMTIVRIDWDPTEINRIVNADIGICGDAKTVVSHLVDSCERRIGKREDRTETAIAEKAKSAAAFAKDVPEQSAYLDAIRAELPEDGILVDEITQVGFASWIGFPVYSPRSLITCGYQGTLGYGYATALGVKVAHPDRPVVAIAGDGGFMFQVQELATAAQYRINMPVIVFNNGKFGNVRRHQKEWYDGRYIGSELHNPRFADMAETFGVAGYKAGSPEELRSALRRALKEDGPSLIEVEVGDMSSPWKYILRERARGVTRRK